MEVKPSSVKELRDKTGAGVMDCKKALAEANGDLEKATAWLHDNGIAQAAKRAGRKASEGSVGSYIHAGGKLGVIVEVNCESDFVAKTDDFQALVKEIAMQVAAANPRVVRREELAPEIVEQERQIYAQQAQASGKPEAVIAKIVDGKMEKFLKDVCLLEQSYVRDPNRTINDLVLEFGVKLKEKIDVRRFVRFQLGESAEAKTA
ncbi:MAG: translation elongation factor Ts [Candidatus Binataceae bacterium]